MPELNLPNLNNVMGAPATATNTRDKFQNITIIDSEGNTYGSIGFLKDANMAQKVEDTQKLFDLVGFKLTTETNTREVASMDFTKLTVK